MRVFSFWQLVATCGVASRLLAYRLFRIVRLNQRRLRDDASEPVRQVCQGLESFF